MLANNDEPSPTEYKNEEDLEFGVCHEILLTDDRKISLSLIYMNYYVSRSPFTNCRNFSFA